MKHQKLIWLDCDPGHDDAMAIILACQHPDIQLLGISTVFGNQSVDKTTQNALKMLHICRDNSNGFIPVLKGAAQPLTRSAVFAEHIHGKTGLDGPSFPNPIQQESSANAIQFMYETIIQQEEKVHLVVTGGHTNIALLLQMYPQVKTHIEEIVFMGGSISLGNITPQAEFNMYIDPEAAHIVLQSGLPITMHPLELTHTVRCTDDILNRIQSLDTEFSKIVVDLLTFFKKAYQTEFGFDSPPVHDPVTIAWLVAPELFTHNKYHVSIECQSDYSDGATIVDLYHVLNKQPNVRVCTAIDVTGFWEIMLQAVERANNLVLI